MPTSDSELRARLLAMSPQARRALFDRASPAELEVLERVTRPADSGASRWLHDPAGFARDALIWPADQSPVGYQTDMLTRLAANGRLAARGPHGLGKTATAAIGILWFALTRDDAKIDWKVVTTASVWRQLTKYLWPEVHKWSKRLHTERLGRPLLKPDDELLNMSISLEHGEAFAAASNDHEKIEGAHADHILYVFDEAKAIPDPVWDAAEGALSGDGIGTNRAYALAISTPGEPQGRFHDIHDGKPGLQDWDVLHVTLDDAIEAGRISVDWAQNRRKQWGPDTALYRNRVLGEFASSRSDGVIPLAWVEAANERWYERQAEGFGRLTDVGVDVARTGLDDTTFALRHGDTVASVVRRHGIMTTETTEVARGYASDGQRLVVDVIGVGAGVVDQLRKAKCRVVAFNASEGTDRKDASGELGFVNCRSAAWWHLRELLDPDGGSTVALPPDSELTADLTAPSWKVQGKGKIRVEGKDDIRKRLGRSTDAADAVIHAFWPVASGGPVRMSVATGQIPSGIM